MNHRDIPIGKGLSRGDRPGGKEGLREWVWREMEEGDIALFPRPVYGRIPNFKGSWEAAARLAQLDVWRKAHLIKINPDSPQRALRERALREGKRVLMPTPRLRRGFLLLDPGRIPRGKVHEASSIRGAFRLGLPIGVEEVEGVQLVIMGSVAVDRLGGRVGKGGGYSDLEYGILREIGALDEDTPTATTVHGIQVVEEVPMTGHDVPLDYIVTPSQVIETGTSYRKPPGILWGEVGEELMERIPLLREVKEFKSGKSL